jgi:hypothetical protein
MLRDARTAGLVKLHCGVRPKRQSPVRAALAGALMSGDETCCAASDGREESTFTDAAFWTNGSFIFGFEGPL